MKNCKKMNVGFVPHIFTIALVTMLTATTLWAKPKNAVEYSPFKSENLNASVYECEYIKGYDDGLILIGNFQDDYGNKLLECSSIAIYGWKKKKGGWEKLWEYQPKENGYIKTRILNDDSDRYTHYAMEVEVPENSLTFSTQGQRISNDFGFEDSCMVISFSISQDYKKLISEKRAAEEAEQKRRAAEEKAKQNAARDAKGKEIAKGYVYHGIEEDSRNCKLFASKALEEGHAYCISGFVLKYGGSMAAIEYADGFLFSSQSSAVSVEYINQKVKGEIVEAGLTSFFGKTLGVPLTVVVAGGKAPLHTPIVIGLIE